MAAGGGASERGDSHRVPRVRRRVGATLEEDGGARLVAGEERDEVERREAVGRPGAGERRIAIEQRAQPLGPAERGRLEDVEVRVAGQQAVDGRAVRAVKRAQER